MAGTIVPWDGRDQEEQSELLFNAPLRTKNRQLEDENMHLKRILREHGIPWSDSVAGHHAFRSSNSHTALGRRRSSRLSAVGRHRFPHLPVEVILRILYYALVADGPIIDPLSKLNTETLTSAEAKCGPQIAIGFLATCKAYHIDGKRILWSKNKFAFTSPAALRKFGELDFSFRKGIESINLRIVARYYDDETRRHKLSQDYHPELTKSQNLKVIPRTQDDNTMARRGFHSYAWAQTVDFLDALRPPFDPHHAQGNRPRLLPGLLSMRMDFVNFPDYFLPFPEIDLHEIAAHDFGCTLNELMVTGLPCCEVGAKAGNDLQGMVKDDGLFLSHAPSYVQQKKYLKPLCGYEGLARVIRAWRRVALERQAVSGEGITLVSVPSVPEERGHPDSVWRKRRTLWKRVPVTRDSEDRRWIEFDRNTGEPVDDVMDDYDSDDDDSDIICPNCGVVHGHYDYWGSDSD